MRETPDLLPEASIICPIFFEVTGILDNTPYFSHGIDVAYSFAVTAKLREALLELDKPKLKKAEDIMQNVSEIRRVYKSSAEGILKLQEKAGFYDSAGKRAEIYLKSWDDIKKILAEAPSFEKTVSLLKEAGLSLSEFEKLYGTDKTADAVNYAKDLKDRFTVLWLYWDIDVNSIIPGP